jgi:hypothetical protein
MATKVKYKARPGSSITDRQARILGPVIHAIEDRDGICTAKALVEEARSPRCPAHRLVFTCKEDAAAEKYYLARAGNLIRSVVTIEVRMVRDDRKGPPPMIPAFVHVAAPPKIVALPVQVKAGPKPEPPQPMVRDRDRLTGYVSIHRAMADGTKGGMREQVLADALEELHQFKAKYANLVEFANLFREIDKLSVARNPYGGNGKKPEGSRPRA